MQNRIVPAEAMEETFLAQAKLLNAFAQPISSDEILEMALTDRQLIKYATGAYGWFSVPKARPTKFTFNTLDHEFSSADFDRFINIFHGLRSVKRGLYCIDLIGGEEPYTCLIHFIFPLSMAKMAWAYSRIMRPAGENDKKAARFSFYQIMTPGYETEVIQAVQSGVNLMQCGDYVGIPKKAGFTLWLYLINEVLNGFGMHAGYKKITVKLADGSSKDYVIVIIGGSGHGKSTLSFSDFGQGKEIKTLFGGDDMVAVVPDGNTGYRIVGFENRGLYLKVVGVSESHEPLTYEGAMGAKAILENVPMGAGGNPRFEKESETILDTDNHRAIVPLRHFTYGQPPALDIPLKNTELIIILICRTPEHPVMVKYKKPELATAFFGALPTEKTSAMEAGAKKGAIKLTCGADPFTPGGSSKKLQRCYEVLKKLGEKATVISINTGERYDLKTTEKAISNLLIGHAQFIELEQFPGRLFMQDPICDYDEKFASNFGSLLANQKAVLRGYSAPIEVINSI